MLQQGMSYNKIGSILKCSGVSVIKRVKKLKLEKYYSYKRIGSSVRSEQLAVNQ